MKMSYVNHIFLEIVYITNAINQLCDPFLDSSLGSESLPVGPYPRIQAPEQNENEWKKK